MKNHGIFDLNFKGKPNQARRLLFAVIIASVSVLTACQKADENEPDTNQQTESSTSLDNQKALASNSDPSGASHAGDDLSVNNTANSDQESSTTQEDSATSTSDNNHTKPEIEVSSTQDIVAPSIPSQPPPQPDPSVAIVGTQISTVDYQGSEGEKLQVIYETSISGELEATAILPDNERISMRAPAGQGNNPTYTSSDGEVQIVSHGGGGSVDLIRNGTIKDFTAVNAEAEVISQ